MAADPRPYPAWWLARARERHALLDGAVARLRRAVRADGDIVGALIYARSSPKLGNTAFGSLQQHPLDLATSWFEQAKRDLDSARYLAAGERFDAACFASQQAAEKALKSALVWLAGDRPRTHELTVLVAEIASRQADAAGALGDVAALAHSM